MESIEFMLSVVIPAYNAEKEISNCIDNILNTNTCDFEIIVINDGSSDDTKKILDDYASKDKRIKAIHQSNQGVSKARNAGIEQAVGDYIIFVDSDDQLENGALDALTKKLENSPVDILQFSVSTDTYTNNTINKKEEYYEEIQFKSTSDAFSYLIEHGFYVVWNKAYKTSFIKEYLDFPLGIKTGEDLIFNCKTFLRNPTVACANAILYHHIRTDKDTTVTRFISNMDETLVSKRESLLSVYNHFHLDLDSYYNIQLTEYKFYVLNLLHKNSVYTKKEVLNKLEKYIYSNIALDEIKNAKPSIKSSKIFQSLVLHTNANVIYLYYLSKTKIKQIIKGK